MVKVNHVKLPSTSYLASRLISCTIKAAAAAEAAAAELSPPSVWLYFCSLHCTQQPPPVPTLYLFLCPQYLIIYLPIAIYLFFHLYSISPIAHVL